MMMVKEVSIETLPSDRVNDRGNVYSHCTVIKPLVYLVLILASAEHQKTLFRGFPGVCFCLALVRKCNNYTYT